MGYISTHHTGIRLNSDNLRNTCLLENAIVCMITYIIVLLEIFLRRMERISILHCKLTHTDHSGSWSCLVTELSLNLVDHKRILIVRLCILTHQLYRSLLMRHSKNQLGVISVSQTDKLTSDALITTGLFPQISWHNNRKKYFLTVNAIHLLTDDILNLCSNSLQCRKLGIDSVTDILHIASTNHQCMTVDHTICRCLLKSLSN